MPCLFVLHF
ncbi:hypothetical protein E2C01_102676 [Portunus trituberculatus]|uniref:Uncharacterized protein n=1 Tax=Portunus trituberculatus TaxID=210409 RepID=A0A5B7KPP6_PORTR|nr:hypothetical protein [Portunus trituberculatus]